MGLVEALCSRSENDLCQTFYTTYQAQEVIEKIQGKGEIQVTVGCGILEVIGTSTGTSTASSKVLVISLTVNGFMFIVIAMLVYKYSRLKKKLNLDGSSNSTPRNSSSPRPIKEIRNNSSDRLLETGHGI